MRSIIRSSLNYRFIVVALGAALMLFGIVQLRNAPLDVLPEFAQPYVEIQTEALGLSAEEVESLITVPLEQDLLNGVAWLDKIHSESVPGLSSVMLFFEPGTNLYRARQMVAERLSQAAVGLPHVSKSPTMLQPTSATSRVMIVALSSKDLSLIQLSTLTRWTVAPRLMGVPGVSNVAIWGLRDRQLQVQVDPERLRAHNVSLFQVLETTGNALWVSTLSFVEASTPGNAGFIDTAQQRLGVRHVLPIISPEGLSQVPIEGSKVRLLDVANVVENHQPLIGDALTPSGAGLLLVIEKFPSSNTLDVTRGLENALTALQPGMGGVHIDTTIFRPATFIEMGLNTLTLALLVGAVLSALALFALQGNWRKTLISAVAIPLSLLASGLVLYLRGATFNIMVLAGFVIALGVLMDDAIMDVDNILRRLHQVRQEGKHLSTATIVLEASAQMRGTMLFATLILFLAVLPVFVLGGTFGAFLQPLAVTYVLAILASTVVALTVTPVLSALLLTREPATPRVSPLHAWLDSGYDRLLTALIRRSPVIYLAIVLMVLLGLGALLPLRPGLLPTFREPDLLLRLQAAPGTSRPEMVRLVAQASRELRSVAGVRNVGTHVGRAIFGDQVVNVNAAEIWVSIDPAANYDQTSTTIQQVIDGYPGLQRSVQTYLAERSAAVVAGAEDPLVVRIYGQKLETRQKIAEEVRQAVASIGGVTDSRLYLPVEEPSLEVEVDLAKAQRYGIKPGDVRRAAATLLNGIQVGSLFEEQKVFDVVVWSTPETRSSLTAIRELLIDTPSGVRVRLQDVANVRIVPAPTAIPHEDVSRYLDVGLRVGARDVGAVAQDVEKRLKQMRFPFEYHAEVVGDYARQQAAQSLLLSVAVAGLLGIFFMFQATFRSWRLALASFLLLPTTLAGGSFAMLLAGGVVSLGSLAGLLAVYGIAVRNNIVQIKHYQRLERQSGESFGIPLVLRGSRELLLPLLLTVLATGLLVAPTLVLGDRAGLEILRPMAVSMLGGFVTLVVFNLFVVPALYLRLAVGGVSDFELEAGETVPQPAVLGGMAGVASPGGD